MTNNVFNWQLERYISKTGGIHSTNTLFALLAQMELLNKKLDNMSVVPHHNQDMSCDLSGGDQDIEAQDYSFSEEVNFMGNFQEGQNNFSRPTQN